AISFAGDECASGNNVPPRELAVEREKQEPTRLQQRDEHVSSGIRIGQVVQHAGRLDDVEAAIERPELANIGLRIFDIVKAERERLPFRISEAGETEIDRKDAGAG